MSRYRPLSDDELDDFHAMVQYAFSITEGPWSPDDADSDGEPSAADDAESTDDASDLGQAYGYFDDGRLVSICKHYHWQTRVRDDTHRLAGLSAVATRPEHRRQGYVRDMLRAALDEYRADGTYLSVLWPFEHSFYRKLGWGTAFHGFSHRCDPGDLAQFRGGHGGTWLPLDADDWERLDAVHRAHGSQFELTIERTEDWWRDRIFEGWTQDPFVYGYERDGDLAAFVSYVATDDDDDTDGTLLRARDAAWVDQEAREAIYGFLARHESQVECIHLWSTDDDLLWLSEHPREIETERHPAAMFRLVDVAAALDARRYPAAVEAEFVVDVQDPLVDWNDRRFSVDIADGEATITPAEAAEPTASLRIDALSQLYVGARDVAFLTRTGKLSTDDDTARTLDTLFPESQVLLREGF